MTTLTFDTHEFVKELKAAGFSEEQAEAITRLQRTTITTTLEQIKHNYQLDNLATKRNLKETRIGEIDLKVDLVGSGLKQYIAETKAELICWIVGVGVLQITWTWILYLMLEHKYH